jgi:hypothetical protein
MQLPAPWPPSRLAHLSSIDTARLSSYGLLMHSAAVQYGTIASYSVLAATIRVLKPFKARWKGPQGCAISSSRGTA